MPEQVCALHSGQLAKWLCAICGKPLCAACGAGAFQGKIYCGTCLSTVSSAPAAVSPTPERGVGRGVGLAFLLLFAPLPITWIIAILVGRLPADTARSLAPLGYLLALVTNPLVLTLIAWWIARRRGHRGVAKGLLIGLLLWIALTILLVAACFGLIFLLSR